MKSVAVIGAGPGGLVAARYLKSEGFQPVIFEQGDCVGGQWSGDPDRSGVWPSMRTNTSRIMTSFSDLPHPAGTPVYPTNQMMRDYLQRYAEQFELMPCVRLKTRVQEIARGREGRGWTVCFTTAEGKPCGETFEHVIVATGRYHKPMIPAVPGLDSFAGTEGVTHAFGYKDPDRYRGKRVLVAGCSISALEIASDLAMLGASRVVTTYRRQRYVLHKILAGVPTDHVVFTRFGALAEATFPMEVAGEQLKDFVTRTSGSPEQFGALTPSENIFEAGITQSQDFLPLVAEGRIVVKPWMESVEGNTVRFKDGSEEEFDAILFGTGYDLDLPFLSEDLRRTLNADARHIDLHKWTFHPDLPGLAFLGHYELVGPFFATVELQARWIAYAWSGTRPMPAREEMEAGLAEYRARRDGPQEVPMHAAALQFAREAGVEPDPSEWPELARALLYGPLTAISFRLSGPDSLPDAPERVAKTAAAFGAVPTPVLTPEQCVQLKALANARDDAAFTAFVDRVTSGGPDMAVPGAPNSVS